MTNWQKDFWALCFAIVLTLFTFSTLFQVPFLYDDYDFLFTWKSIQNLNHLPNLLMGNVPFQHEGVYRPIRSLLYVVSYHFFHQNLFFYHIEELVLYCACLVFVYLITKQLVQDRFISFLTTLIFGIMPLHIDNVANLTGNFDTFSLLLVLISFYLFQHFLENKKHTFLLLFFSLLAATLAYFGYEVSLSLPFLIILYGFYKRQKVSWMVYCSYFALAAVYLFIRIDLLHITTRGSLFEDIYVKIILLLERLFMYFALAFVPVPLEKITLSSFTGDLLFSSASKPFVTPQEMLSGDFLFSLVCLLLLLFLTIKTIRKRSLIGFCLAWFFVSLLSVLGIAFQSSPTYGIQMLWGRYAFIATYGTALLTAYFFSHLLGIKPKTMIKQYLRALGIVVISLFLLFDIAVTHATLSQWHDPRPQLLTIITQTEKNAVRHNDLGVLAASYGKYDEAIKEFKKSLAITPSYDKAEKNLLKLCEKLKKSKKSAASCP
ncbi:MAG TPA: tetratricopeptide repeat protein [Methylomirabilota bacterium]|nr:tetratricopeptide repeat protein [Methylomirabilota bacterium]